MVRLRQLALLALMVGLVGQVSVPRAEACSVAPDSITVHDTPANGVVVVDIGCSFGGCFDSELPTELEVMDKTTGEMVAGSLVESFGSIDGVARLLWKPTGELVVGHTYELLWQPEAAQSFAELDYEFTALAAASWSVEDIEVVATTQLGEVPTETVSCTQNNNFDCGPNEPATFTYEIGVNAAECVSIQIAVEGSPEGSDGQYVVSAAHWGQGDTMPELEILPSNAYDSPNTSTIFETAYDAYCYRVEVTSLIDDSVAVHEDCIEHTFGELTTKDLADEELEQRLAQCINAPDDYLEPWCMGRRVTCENAEAVQYDEPGCDTLAETCREVFDRPMDPVDPNEPNDPDDPTDPGDTDEPSDGESDGEDPKMNAEPQLEGGCSAVPGQRGAMWPALLLATLWLAARTRRSR